MTDFERLLGSLAASDVEFILVGGMAGVVHGSARLTQDIDIVYARSRDNLHRRTCALEALAPYPRGAPEGLPFRWDETTLARGLNFTLTTTAGDIDLLGEIICGGRYEDLLPFSLELRLFGQPVHVLALEKLIDVKRAAGRPKDFEAIAELEALLVERQRGE